VLRDPRVSLGQLGHRAPKEQLDLSVQQGRRVPRVSLVLRVLLDRPERPEPLEHRVLRVR